MSVRIHEEVTGKIVADLERGVAPWVKPWESSGRGGECMPRNAATRRAYRGVNVLMLWAAAARGGYPLPWWLTFRQAKELGGFVRKGERATPIVLVKRLSVEDESGREDDGAGAAKQVTMLRYFFVFNVAQVEGLPSHLCVPPEPKDRGERHARAEALLSAIGADVRHGGDRACYVPSTDCIMLPPFAAFQGPEHYYATSLHEHAHWSGHQSRLARDLSGRFGSRAYAAEELVAELVAAFLCAELAIEGRLRHAEYIGSWLPIWRCEHIGSNR